MAIPTKAEEFSKLIEHLRLGAEASATLGHLHADENKLISHGYLGISQLLDRMVIQVTQLATKGRFN